MQAGSTHPQNYGFLCLVLVAYTALWLLYPHHLIMSDPWGYSELSYLISQWNLTADTADNIFVHRLGATVPTAIFYSLFGVNILTTNLSSLLAALAILVTIWLALPSLNARLVGVALCATNIPFFQMSAHLYPDLISAAFMALSTLMLMGRMKPRDPLWRQLLPVAAAFCLFAAFLAKLSAYWVLPLWLLAFGADMRSGRRELLQSFYLPFALGCLVLGLLYLAYNAMAWGNPLVRFSNVSSVVEAGLWAVSGPDAGEILWQRLTSGALFFLLYNYGIVLLPALAAMFFLPPQLRMWAYYTVITLLFFWFGTTSFSSYQPMPLVERYPLPSLPGMCILAGYFFANLKLPYLGPSRSLNQVLSLLIIGLSAYAFNGYISSWKQLRWFENEAVQAIKHHTEAEPGAETLIVSLDGRSPDSLKFFYEYEYPLGLSVVSAAELRQRYSGEELARFDQVYLYQNQQMALFLNRAYDQPLMDVSALEQRGRRIYQGGGLSVDLLQGGLK